MTTGALIFAYDNEHINYQMLAAWSADNIRRHLGIPVAVITDVECAFAHKFDKVILHPRTVAPGHRNFVDAGSVTWFNSDRTNAYQLSPWSRTVLLDADYVVASSSLLSLLQSKQEFLVHDHAFDITGKNDFSALNRFGQPGLPMSWATLMIWSRGDHARHVFDSMDMIKKNWRHYLDLYNIRPSTYRNDFALSIALGIANGHAWSQEAIPWPLATVMPDHELAQLSEDVYRVDYIDSDNKHKYLHVAGHDFHAMGKKYLGDIVVRSFA